MHLYTRSLCCPSISWCWAAPIDSNPTGGVGQRTPLHIVFTDYVSPSLTQVMVKRGSKAAFMKDKQGFLPLHVAVSRHVSPSKLRMLLEVNPAAILERTNEGKSALDIAKETAN